MNIYIARKNKSYGPYTADQFQSHINAGKVAPNDQVWIQTGWHSAEDLPCVLEKLCKVQFKGSLTTKKKIANR